MFLFLFYGIIYTRDFRATRGSKTTTDEPNINRTGGAKNPLARETIKSCPHCGGQGVLQQTYSYKIRKYFVSVRCDICGATGKPFTADDAPSEKDWQTTECSQAIKAWNMRYKEEERD